MTDTSRVPISTFSRIAAGTLGAFILGVGLWLAVFTFERSEWLFVGFGLLVGLGASPVFLYAAYMGSSPRWPDEG